jgi:hypothetical protein
MARDERLHVEHALTMTLGASAGGDAVQTFFDHAFPDPKAALTDLLPCDSQGGFGAVRTCTPGSALSFQHSLGRSERAVAPSSPPLLIEDIQRPPCAIEPSHERSTSTTPGKTTSTSSTSSSSSNNDSPSQDEKPTRHDWSLTLEDSTAQAAVMRNKHNQSSAMVRMARVQAEIDHGVLSKEQSLKVDPFNAKQGGRQLRDALSREVEQAKLAIQMKHKLHRLCDMSPTELRESNGTDNDSVAVLTKRASTFGSLKASQASRSQIPRGRVAALVAGCSGIMIALALPRRLRHALIGTRCSAGQAFADRLQDFRSSRCLPIRGNCLGPSFPSIQKYSAGLASSFQLIVWMFPLLLFLAVQSTTLAFFVSPPPAQFGSTIALFSDFSVWRQEASGSNSSLPGSTAATMASFVRIATTTQEVFWQSGGQAAVGLIGTLLACILHKHLHMLGRVGFEQLGVVEVMQFSVLVRNAPRLEDEHAKAAFALFWESITATPVAAVQPVVGLPERSAYISERAIATSTTLLPTLAPSEASPESSPEGGDVFVTFDRMVGRQRALALFRRPTVCCCRGSNPPVLRFPGSSRAMACVEAPNPNALVERPVTCGQVAVGSLALLAGLCFLFGWFAVSGFMTHSSFAQVSSAGTLIGPLGCAESALPACQELLAGLVSWAWAPILAGLAVGMCCPWIVRLAAAGAGWSLRSDAALGASMAGAWSYCLALVLVPACVWLSQVGNVRGARALSLHALTTGFAIGLVVGHHSLHLLVKACCRRDAPRGSIWFSDGCLVSSWMFDRHAHLIALVGACLVMPQTAPLVSLLALLSWGLVRLVDVPLALVEASSLDEENLIHGAFDCSVQLGEFAMWEWAGCYTLGCVIHWAGVPSVQDAGGLLVDWEWMPSVATPPSLAAAGLILAAMFSLTLAVIRVWSWECCGRRVATAALFKPELSKRMYPTLPPWLDPPFAMLNRAFRVLPPRDPRNPASKLRPVKSFLVAEASNSVLGPVGYHPEPVATPRGPETE